MNTELDWHKPTSAELDGAGYEIVLDVTPGITTSEAAEYEGVLVRIGKPGWEWLARKISKKEVWHDLGAAETQAQALADGLEAIRRRMETK